MSLKDLIYSDIDNVFLNEDEFAFEVTIRMGEEDITLTCVPDDDLLTERKDKAANGTLYGDRLIFLKISDLPGRPNVGSRLTYQGKPYFVMDCVDNFGMYEVRIGANKT